MLKWYQETEDQHDVFMAGRIRLVRNLAHYPFPVKLSGEESAKLEGELREGLSGIGSVDGKTFRTLPLSSMEAEGNGAASTVKARKKEEKKAFFFQKMKR